MKKLYQFSLGQMILFVTSFLIFAFLDFYLGAKLGPHFFWGIDLGEAKNPHFLPDKLTEEELMALVAEEGEVAITFHQELENKVDTAVVVEEPLPPPPEETVKPVEATPEPEPIKPAEVAEAEPEPPKVEPKKVQPAKPAPKVAVKPPPKPEKEVPPPATPEPVARFTLKVGSFSSYKEAEILASKFQGRGFAARIETVQIPDKGNWYRVHVGRYPTQDAANSQKSQIERSFGIMPVIVSL